ncbi:MAG: hypothetical protein WCE23_13100 [Candidatus Binatus sp.]|uniref:hypothetical protein n=1 Tax=Candidatus Binatus sp. TaxID=2811406 RepID=UPI003C72CB90
MITTRKRGWTVAVAASAIILTMAGARPAFSADALKFPPTRFVILNPDTGIAIGWGQYRLENTADSATLHGENHYYDDQSDLETGELQLGAGGEPPRLVEFDHTFFNADGSVQRRAHLDLKSGAATCIDNSGAKKSDQAELLIIPDNTWAGASIAIPIQDLLRAPDRGLARPIHVFNCAPGPKIFAISVKIDPANAVWAPYGAEAIRVEVRPDFGWLNVIVAPLAPKIHAWFDPKDGFTFLGDDATRYYKGPRIMLVKTR